MKKRLLCIFSALIVAVFCLGVTACGTRRANDELSSLKAMALGIGGGGMLFDPSRSTKILWRLCPDMGGIYVSHNAGVDWKRTNIRGLVQKAYFDLGREGVVYAGGSGLYRSTDNGDTFRLIFPKEQEILERRTSDETTMHYFFASGNYPTYKLVKDILVDPDDSDNIFVLMYYGKEGTIFESKDNGQSFDQIISFTKKNSYGVWGGYKKLLYRK